MKFFQFILCFLLTLSTIHGITVYENSNLKKRSPTPYHSYIEFEDKREDGGYAYKFQIEGDHAEQETHWPKPKAPQTNQEEDSSYLPQNYEQLQSYTHHVPVPLVRQPNVHNKQEQQIETGPQPQITFESNQGTIQHEKENKVIFHNYPHGPEANLQPFPNLFYPNHERRNPSSNSEPIKLSQIPIVTKYVPVPVKYIPMPVKDSVIPSRGHIKFASASLNAIPTETKPIIYMHQPNVGLTSEATNAPVKYIMIPVKPSLNTEVKHMYNEHVPEETQYQPNLPNQQQHFSKFIQHQQQMYEEEKAKEHHKQIKHNIPIKYIDNSKTHLNNKKEEIKYIPQKVFIKPIQSNNQFHFKQNQEIFNEDIQDINGQKNNQYLPNRLAHPFVDKKVVQYHIKTNIPEKNIPPVEGQPMYEYKTIQEEDYKKSQPSVEYEMLNMPEFINKLPINTIDFQQKFGPQNIGMHPQQQQNFMLPNNIPLGMNMGPVNNLQATFGGNHQFQQLSPEFGHDSMQTVNFNLDAKRRSTKRKESLKSNQMKMKYPTEQAYKNI